MQKLIRPYAVDRVRAVEELDVAPVAYTELVVMPADFGKFLGHPFVRATPSSCPRSTMNGRGVIRLASSA